jgi:hypothetical protein
MKPSNCLDCPFHKVIADPDPHDWFNDDDQAVVCRKVNNDSIDLNSKYVADRQAFKTVTVSCRPYNLRKESNTPKWCPL